MRSSSGSSAASRTPTAGSSSSGSGTPRTSSPSPAAAEGPRLGGETVRRVAALADVHGNAPALEAVLQEVAREDVDLVVFCGDLTWGPLPLETLALVEPWRHRARFVRGNADRAVGSELEGRGAWMAERHGAEARGFLAGFAERVSLELDVLGPTLFCHGSPRADIECVTSETPVARVREFVTGVTERVIVTAHTHVQFDRLAEGRRLLNPGSVGMPYETERGAYWALLGPDVDLRRTAYDVEAAAERFRASGDPDGGRMAELLLSPPPPREVIDHAEALVFSE